MTLSRALVTIGNSQDLSAYAEKWGAAYRPLERQEAHPAHELFRLDKYQQHYDQLLFVGDTDFQNTENLFALESGHTIHDSFALFVVTKSMTRIFEKPPTGTLLLEAGVRSLILSRIPPIGYGPGTELDKIFKWLGFPSCRRCTSTARKMDLDGTDKCRSNFETLVARITTNVRANRIVVDDRAKAGIESLLEIAIERAEGKNTVTQTATLAAAKTYLAFVPPKRRND